MNNKELKSLVALLEDDDTEVVAHVEEKLKTLGTGVIPFLEEAWEQTFNPKAHERIEDLVHFLQFELVQEVAAVMIATVDDPCYPNEWQTVLVLILFEFRRFADIVSVKSFWHKHC